MQLKKIGFTFNSSQRRKRSLNRSRHYRDIKLKGIEYPKEILVNLCLKNMFLKIENRVATDENAKEECEQSEMLPKNCKQT